MFPDKSITNLAIAQKLTIPNRVNTKLALSGLELLRCTGMHQAFEKSPPRSSRMCSSSVGTESYSTWCNHRETALVQCMTLCSILLVQNINNVAFIFFGEQQVQCIIKQQKNIPIEHVTQTQTKLHLPFKCQLSCKKEVTCMHTSSKHSAYCSQDCCLLRRKLLLSCSVPRNKKNKEHCFRGE